MQNQENLTQTPLESRLSDETLPQKEKLTKLWTFWTFLGTTLIFLILGGLALAKYSGGKAVVQPQDVKRPDIVNVNQTPEKEGSQLSLIIATRECRDIAKQVRIKKVVAKTDTEIYAVAELTEQEKSQLLQQSCVKKITNDKNEAKNLISAASQTLQQETTRDIKDNKLEKSILGKDIQSKEDLVRYLKAKHGVTPIQPGQISNYQAYVTPGDAAVSQVAQNYNGYEPIYDFGANNWVWVSDEVLYGQLENWVYPNYFLTATPSLPSNPVSNYVAGDCEDQANALVSTIRADGLSADNVRTVLGLVNFNGNIGGHAWVEVYQDNQWVPLDATSGPYYNNGQFVQTQALPFDYFATHEFPVLERWFYYNDQYFMDISANSGNAPVHWAQSGTPSFEF